MVNMVSMPSQRNNKLCTNVHHCDLSTAVALFANWTCFVDMPCALSTACGEMCYHDLDSLAKQFYRAFLLYRIVLEYGPLPSAILNTVVSYDL
jgi:hypothetical protein